MIDKLEDHAIYDEFGVTGYAYPNNKEIADKINEILDYINGNIPTLDIRYHHELFPDLKHAEKNGNFYDLYTAEETHLYQFDYTMINLGVSVKIPKGYWLQIVPRSSTFKNYYIMQTNSFGVIDTDYCGDNDIIKLPATTLRSEVIIPANTRICQFRLVKDIYFDLKEVEKLLGPDRGGFGSTGVN